LIGVHKKRKTYEVSLTRKVIVDNDKERRRSHRLLPHELREELPRLGESEAGVEVHGGEGSLQGKGEGEYFPTRFKWRLLSPRIYRLKAKTPT